MIAAVDIEPPPYKDPVKMLRNLADEIEQDKWGDIETIAIAHFGENGLRCFGGGRNSGMEACAFVFGSAQVQLLRIPTDLT